MRTFFLNLAEESDRFGSAQALQALDVLASLPNLKTLCLGPLVLQLIESSSDNPATPLYLDPFRCIAPRLESLQLEDFTTALINQILPLFPNITSLRLHGISSLLVAANQADQAQQQQQLAITISELRNLEIFSAEQPSPTTRHFGISNLWQLPWSSSATLRHLSFLLSVVDADLLSFIGRCAPTLETLSIDFDFFNVGATDGIALPPFTRLHSLMLSGNASDVAYLLAATTSAPLHTLSVTVHLASSATFEGDHPSRDLIETTRQQLLSDDLFNQSLRKHFSPSSPSRRTVGRLHLAQKPEFDHQAEIPPSISILLHALAQDLGSIRRPPFKTARGTFFGRRNPYVKLEEPVMSTWTEADHEAHRKIAGEEMERVLEMSKMLVRSAVRQGDDARVEGLLKTIQPLHEILEIEMD